MARRGRACTLVKHHPSQMSGGQRQRVAIARALAGAPRIVLADEPTASLDKQSGREVVDLMQNLARKQGVTVLLVTHDNRILDIADRIVHLEDGRLTTFIEHVTANTQHMMDMLARNNRKGDLHRRIAEAPEEQLPELLAQATASSEEFLRVTELSQDDAFQSMFEEVLTSFTLRFGQLLDAERASIFLVDAPHRELWLKVAQGEEGRAVDLRIPIERASRATSRRPGRACASTTRTRTRSSTPTSIARRASAPARCCASHPEPARRGVRSGAAPQQARQHTLRRAGRGSLPRVREVDQPGARRLGAHECDRGGARGAAQSSGYALTAPAVTTE